MKKRFRKPEEFVCERCGNELPYRRRQFIRCRFCGWDNEIKEGRVCLKDYGKQSESGEVRGSQ